MQIQLKGKQQVVLEYNTIVLLQKVLGHIII